LPNIKASITIPKLKSNFACYSIPDQVISDNGLQLASDKFANFARMWDFFLLLTSSQGNSKAIGKAESELKTAEVILKKSVRAGTMHTLIAVLNYRNMPTQGMTTSPALCLMS